ncbi:MAG: sugar phosphate isomerase/epimerase [Bacteroidetes bacterium]|nr:sugar phosphate isomerase/epimerase [Bacteroidota bacterium]MDA1121786.1 sugar phosphate isomerase/epimerase [Bacteroidota bacterium]
MKKHIVLALAVLAIVFDYSSVSAQKKGLYTAELGIAPYTFRRSFPKGLEATLDTIQMMGFTEIEGGGGRGVDLADYRKMCEARGISIPSMGTGYNQLVEDPQGIADKARILGAKYVMCAWIDHERGNFTLENAQKAVADFNAAGKVLKENGVTFCYHTHGYEFQPYEDGTLMDYIIKNTNPEYVSFEMDVFWVQFGGGDPVKLLKKYKDRWKLIHLKDMHKDTKKDMTGLTDGDNDVAFGTGQMDIPGIIKAANKIGIKHFFIEDESSFPSTQVPKSIAYLKSL